MDWPTLIARYGDRVLLVSRSILHDDDLSRDAAQETLLKLGRSNGAVENWDAWVMTVAGNTARDYRRRRRPMLPLQEDQVRPDTSSPIETAIARESKERIRTALEALPVADRDLLLLKFREGLSGRDIAIALGITLEAAWQKMSRALRALKVKLGESHE